MVAKLPLGGKAKVLAPVRANVGITRAYQRKIDALVEEMHRSVLYWIKAAYRANTPEIAQDKSPAATLRDAMRKLARRWLRRFDDEAPELARWFATTSAARSDAALRSILKRAGMTVEFRLTAPMNDVVQASIAENVALIRSIPQQYFLSVEGSVMRSVQAGRDLGALARELEQHYGVTRRRASTIARDQNNKSTATITRVRQQDLGITQAVWRHSAGGIHPRPEHVKAGLEGLVYEVAKGAFLEGKWTWPGVEINCRCVSRAIIPGLAR